MTLLRTSIADDATGTDKIEKEKDNKRNILLVRIWCNRNSHSSVVKMQILVPCILSVWKKSLWTKVAISYIN